MRRYFAITLLAAVLTMNMDMVCQSLCLSGHNDMAGAHASHKTANHEMPKGEMCPVTHNHTNESHHDMPQTSLKCDCSVDQAASLGYEITLAKPVLDVKPLFTIVSKIHSQKEIFLSSEPILLEGPPKIIS